MNGILEQVIASAPGYVITEQDNMFFKNCADVIFSEPVANFYEGGTEQMLKDVIERFDPKKIYTQGVAAGFNHLLEPQANYKRFYDFKDGEISIIWAFFEQYRKHYESKKSPLQAIPFLKQATFDIANSIYLQGFNYGTQHYLHSGHRGMILFDRFVG